MGFATDVVFRAKAPSHTACAHSANRFTSARHIPKSCAVLKSSQDHLRLAFAVLAFASGAEGGLGARSATSLEQRSTWATKLHVKDSLTP